MSETLAYGIHLLVLSESYLTNTNMTGFMVFKNLCFLVLLKNVASVLEGLRAARGQLPNKPDQVCAATEIWLVVQHLQGN